MSVHMNRVTSVNDYGAFKHNGLLHKLTGPICRLHDSLSRNLFGDPSLIKGNLTSTAIFYFLESLVFTYKK